MPDSVKVLETGELARFASDLDGFNKEACDLLRQADQYMKRGLLAIEQVVTWRESNVRRFEMQATQDYRMQSSIQRARELAREARMIHERMVEVVKQYRWRAYEVEVPFNKRTVAAVKRLRDLEAALSRYKETPVQESGPAADEPELFPVDPHEARKDVKLSDYYSEQDFACKDDGMVVVNPNLVEKLQQMAKSCGGKLSLTNAYRSPEHNQEVGGAGDSYHMYGIAADIVVPEGSTVEEIAKLAKEAGFTGIGRYHKRGFVHVDVRETSFEWDNYERGNKE
jgi:hypothetical protein